LNTKAIHEWRGANYSRAFFFVVVIANAGVSVVKDALKYNKEDFSKAGYSWR
jgi:hypothetical protein